MEGNRPGEGVIQMAAIFKKKGVWYLDFYAPDGKRVRKSLKTSSKRLAEFALHDLELKLAKNDLGLLVKDIPLDRHVEDFLTHKKSTLTPAAFARLELSLRTHLLPFFQEHNVRGLKYITPWLIEKYLAMRTEKKIKKATLNHELCALKNMLNLAVEWNRLAVSPAAKVKYLKVTDQKPPRFLSLEEVNSFLDHLEDIWFVLAFTALHTGFRLGELMQLEWQDVDWQREQLRVAHDGRRHTKSKKTRYLPLHPELSSVLKGFNEGQPSQDTREGLRVFPVAPLEARQHIYKAYGKAGIQGACVHTLRHTFASHLVMQGVDIYTVSRLLGHSDIKTTQIYAHLAPDHLKLAISKFPKFGHPIATPEKSRQENLDISAS
jgi:integrase